MEEVRGSSPLCPRSGSPRSTAARRNCAAALGVSIPLVGADPATFSVKDWAVLLTQGGPEAVLGKQVDLSGYVLDRGENDVFFIARFAVSCCAVDAQPIGVPAYRPGWREEIEPGAWITIQGAFVKNPSPDSQESVAIEVGSLARIDEPDQPYVF
jgi:putative membrane protein